MNLIQNSALSFSVCLEDKYRNFDQFLKKVSRNFEVSYDKDVKLYTIRHATNEAVSFIENRGTVVLKQLTGAVVQIVSN